MNWAIWLIRIGGVVFVVVGLLAHVLPRNRWGGIRFSYTLADEDVWRKVHARFRWPILFLGLLCLLFPLNSLQQSMLFTYILVGLLIVIPIAVYFYGRHLYVCKYGTSGVIATGFFKYEPPTTSRDEDHYAP